MKKIFLLFLTSFSFISLFSQQIKSFSSDSTAYIEQLMKFTDNYISNDEKIILNSFVTYWNSPECTQAIREEIVSNSNLLLKKNGRPSPQFISYFELILLWNSGNYAKLDYPEWEKTFSFCIESKTTSLKVINQFLELSLNLLKYNRLYDNAATIWRVPQSDFKFSLNKNIPTVIFKDVDLICNSKRDSIIINRTSGILNVEEMTWSGSKGIVSWERAGLPVNEVYAELNKYKITLSKTEYKADSVIFHYKKYLDYPLDGRIEEKVMLISDPDDANYPKFFSYQNKYILNDLFQGINFTGGLSMQGSRLTGTGNEYNPAVLDIFEKDTLRMKLKSSQILISKNGIRSASVSLATYLDTDSIFHPDLQFNYNESTDEFRFTKSKGFTSEGPYRNTYHKIDMNFDEWLWKRNSNEILFKPSTGSTQGNATFESNSFFNYDFFEKLQGMDFSHPLVNLWQYGQDIGLNRFPASNYADYLGIDVSTVRQQLMKLSRMGFIYFDDVADLVTLSEKLDYFIKASIGQVDYDVIYFSSNIQSPKENAKLNLRNFDLLINGVDRIFLSDSQNVVLIPDHNQILMKRNRNFQFSGVIRAGLFTFYGNNFFFDYNGFKINLQNIDSLDLSVKTNEYDNYGQAKIRNIDNMIEKITGELLIDDPGNKSGLVDFPQYPVFTSRENSFVYFDEPEIQKGVYTKNDVYFVVYPFTVDSLDNFSQKEFQIAGKFESSGMIPTLEQKLTLRDDYSLGFYYKAPSEGIPIYNGKGSFYNDIELSSRGLHGYGQIDYLTSTTFSDDFLFHPDSLMAVSRKFDIAKQTVGTEFPKVNSSNNKISWYPKKDQFYVFKKDRDFTMFSDTVNLNGNLLLEPKGLSGNGRMNLVDATVGSKLFNYKSEKILADSSDFRLAGTEKPSMNTDNVNINIDYDQRKGAIRSNSDFSFVEFQENRYISKLDFFNWDMTKKEIEMGLTHKLDAAIPEDSLSGARYISVNPSQDSLSFVSDKTIFDYKNELINAQKVPYIQVADARIFPKEGKLTVEKNAKIRRLSKANILADYTNRYYSLYNGNVDIFAKKKYTASADYDYIDETSRAWKIHFDELKVDSTIQTIGKAAITVIDSFKLSPHFEYQGDVRLFARRPDLTFDGATRLIHSCNVGRSWLKFKAELNPDSLLIPVSTDPLDINLKKIFAGSMIARDSVHIYSTFVSGRKQYFDSYLTKASGVMRYDNKKGNFEIGDTSKLADKSLPGNYLKMNTDSCYIYGEGQLSYNMDFGQVKSYSTGNGINYPTQNIYESNALFGIDFFFSPLALEAMAKDLDSLANLKAYDITNPFYKKALRDYIGLQSAETMEMELGLYGNYKTIPENFNKTLILSEVKLKWNQNTRSFRYHGPVGVIRVGAKAVNKVVDAYIELSDRGSGDNLDIYLSLDSRTYYYFGYTPGSMQVTSSNKTFNSVVYGLKDTERRVKGKAGMAGYIYALAPDRRVELFLRRYQDAEESEKDDNQGN